MKVTKVDKQMQTQLQLIDHLEQTIHSLECAVALEQNTSGRNKPCEYFVTAIAALKTKLSQELTNLKDQ